MTLDDNKTITEDELNAANRRLLRDDEKLAAKAVKWDALMFWIARQKADIDMIGTVDQEHPYGKGNTGCLDKWDDRPLAWRRTAMTLDDNKPMTVTEILKDWLKSHGYDGLYHEDSECGCLVGDLGPCGEIGGSCKAGVLGKCNPETCANDGHCDWHIVERGHHDQMTEDERKKFKESKNPPERTGADKMGGKKRRRYQIERGIYVWEVDLSVTSKDGNNNRGEISLFLPSRFENEADIRLAAIELATQEYCWKDAEVIRCRPVNKHLAIFVAGYEPWVMEEAAR